MLTRMRLAAPAAFFAALAALALHPFHASAQLRYGADVGWSRSTLAGDGVEDADARNGFRIGGHLIAPLGGTFSFQTGLAFVQKGASQTVDLSEAGLGTAEIELQLDYLELPLLARADVGSGSVTGHLLAGPALAFEVGCNVAAAFQDGPTRVEFEASCDEEDFEAETVGVDVGLLFGGGAAWAVSPAVALSGQVGYALGLRNIDDSGAGADIKNRALYLSVGATFRPGTR